MLIVRIFLFSLLVLGGANLTAQDGPVGVPGLLAAIPFHLDQPYVHHWRAERPPVRSGYILVLEVIPFKPKQTAEPILYVGGQTAERVNTGYPSGRVIAIVPGALNDPQNPAFLDLTRVPIWFGTPGLPERVDASKITAQRAEADAAAIQPFSADQVAGALAAGGDAVRVRSKIQLLGVLADLVSTYSPDEEELVEMLRTPRN